MRTPRISRRGEIDVDDVEAGIDEGTRLSAAFSATAAKAADSAAGDNTAETPIYVAAKREIVERATWTAFSRVAASSANYATITLRAYPIHKSYSAGGGDVLGVLDTTTNDLPELRRAEFTLRGDNAKLEENTVVTYEITKSGTGAVIPRSLLGLDIQRT